MKLIYDEREPDYSNEIPDEFCEGLELEFLEEEHPDLAVQFEHLTKKMDIIIEVGSFVDYDAELREEFAEWCVTAWNKYQEEAREYACGI